MQWSFSYDIITNHSLESNWYNVKIVLWISGKIGCMEAMSIYLKLTFSVLNLYCFSAINTFHLSLVYKLVTLCLPHHSYVTVCPWKANLCFSYPCKFQHLTLYRVSNTNNTTQIKCRRKPWIILSTLPHPPTPQKN